MENAAGFDLADYGRIIRKHLVAVLLIPVLCAGAALALTLRMEPTYKASASVYLSLQTGSSVSELVQGSTYVQNLVRSYASIANMPIVLNAVIDELYLDQDAASLAKSVTTSAPLDTAIIKIEVEDHSPELAADIANAISTELSTVVSNLSPKGDQANQSEGVKITTVSPAVAPEFPVSPNKKLSAVAGLVAGLALAAIYIIAVELLNTRIRTEGDLEALTDVPLLGTVPADKALQRSPLSAGRDSFGPSAEAFRHLRTGLVFVSSTRPMRSIVVTSATPGEGKSTVSLALAETYGRAGKRVLLVDADLRRPTLASLTGIEGAAGLTDVLTGTAKLSDVTQEYGEQGVTLLAAGTLPPNPSELLGSHKMERIVKDTIERYDVVVFDCAPALPVTDSAVLGSMCDGLLLVVRSGKSKRTELPLALSRLSDAGVRPIGLVLNGAAQGKRDGYGSYSPTDAQRRPIP